MKKFILLSAALACFFISASGFAKSLPEFSPGTCGSRAVKYKTAPASMPWNTAERVAAARDFMAQGDIINSIAYYKSLKDSAEWNEIRPEYALALALGGMSEPAMNCLDNSRQQEPFGSAAYYYAGWIFSLAGYRSIGNNMWDTAKNGGGYHAALAQKAAGAAAENNLCGQKMAQAKDLPRGVKQAQPKSQDAKEGLKAAMISYSEGKYFHAAYLFCGLSEKYPGWVVAYMGCSLALEGAGAFDAARDCARAAETLTGLSADDRKKISERVNELGKMKEEEKDAWMRDKNPENENAMNKEIYVLSFGGANAGFGGGSDFTLSLSGKLGVMIIKEMDVSLGLGYETVSGLVLSVSSAYRYYFDDNYSINPGAAVNFGVSENGLSISIALNGGFSWYLDNKSSSADIIVSLNKSLASEDPSISAYVGMTRYF